MRNQVAAILPRTALDLDGLIAAIAEARVLHPLKLRGKELKFLRKALDYTSKRFAEELDVREETVSRWENDKEPIRPTIEKIIRLTVAFGLASKAPAVDFSGADVVGLKLQPFCSSKHMPVMRFERVRIKLPSNKKEPHWDRTDQAA